MGAADKTVYKKCRESSVSLTYFLYVSKHNIFSTSISVKMNSMTGCSLLHCHAWA